MVNKNLVGALLLLQLSGARRMSAPDIEIFKSCDDAVPYSGSRRASFSLDQSDFSDESCRSVFSEPENLSNISEEDQQNMVEYNFEPTGSFDHKKMERCASFPSPVFSHRYYPYPMQRPLYPVPHYPMPMYYNIPAYYIPAPFPVPHPVPIRPKPHYSTPVPSDTPKTSPAVISKVMQRLRSEGQDLEQPKAKRVLSTMGKSERGFFIPRASSANVPQQTGHRVIVFGCKENTSVELVAKYFRPCGTIVSASLIEDAALIGVFHISLVFQSAEGASNAVKLAKIVEFPKLGGRVAAARAVNPFTVSGRLLRIDFGFQIPFDLKAQKGLSDTFGRPLRITQQGRFVSLLFISADETQKALRKALTLKLNSNII